MKPFVITPDMTSAAGTFYPTGHVFALFPDEASARAAGDAMQAEGRRDVAHAVPDAVLEHVVRTLGNADEPLPSVGAEGTIVRRIADLSSDGSHALFFPAGDDDSPESLTDTLVPLGAQAAFYYRTLIIEDLVPAPVP